MKHGAWSLRNWEDDSFSDPGVGPLFVLLAMNPNHKGALNMEEFCEYVNELEEVAFDVIDSRENMLLSFEHDSRVQTLKDTITRGGN